MTGQGEISAMCRKLEKRFGKKAIEERRRNKASKAAGISSSSHDEAARAWEQGEGDRAAISAFTKAAAVVDCRFLRPSVESELIRMTTRSGIGSGGPGHRLR